jgi:hypothetical protein
MFIHLRCNGIPSPAGVDSPGPSHHRQGPTPMSHEITRSPIRGSAAPVGTLVRETHHRAAASRRTRSTTELGNRGGVTCGGEWVGTPDVSVVPRRPSLLAQRGPRSHPGDPPRAQGHEPRTAGGRGYAGQPGSNGRRQQVDATNRRRGGRLGPRRCRASPGARRSRKCWSSDPGGEEGRRPEVGLSEPGVCGPRHVPRDDRQAEEGIAPASSPGLDQPRH